MARLQPAFIPPSLTREDAKASSDAATLTFGVSSDFGAVARESYVERNGYASLSATVLGPDVVQPVERFAVIDPADDRRPNPRTRFVRAISGAHHLVVVARGVSDSEVEEFVEKLRVVP